MDAVVAGLSWDEFLIVGIFALCVLGPICIVLLTQNLLGTPESPDAEPFDAAVCADIVPNLGSPVEALDNGISTEKPRDK